MADFSSLKQTIQTYIKQNGNEEITGNILQDVLLAMVSTMGDSAINALASALQDETTARQNQDGILQGNITAEATARQQADTALGGRIDGLQTAINGINTKLAEGYIYAGIATPSTNPGTPSGKVFYIAVSSGTYTNFSNLTAAQGINILKYNGSAWSKDVVYAIDARPKKNSQNFVTSGGVFDNIGALDVSELNATENPHTLAQYADLSAALAAIPTDYQKGGMSVKFVHSSDKRYVQYRYMGTAVNGSPNPFLDTDNWSVCEEYVLVENPKYIYVKTDINNRIVWAIDANGSIYWGAGVPQQVVDYVTAKIEEYHGDNILTFLNGLEEGDSTLLQLLDEKVDIIEGKGLSSNDYTDSEKAIVNTDSLHYSENYSCVTTDNNNRILEGIKSNGLKEINTDIEINGDVTFKGDKTSVVENPKFIEVKTDSGGKFIEGITANGEKHISDFDDETTMTIIRLTGGNIINIPVLDSNFISPIPVVITGTKGNDNAKYEFKVPLCGNEWGIRFKFKITENLLNQNKSATIAYLNGVSITANAVPLTQRNPTHVIDSQRQDEFWPSFWGGVSINGSTIDSSRTNERGYFNRNIGGFAFSIQYVGEEDECTLINDGSSFVLTIGNAVHTFPFSTYESVSELYAAIGEVSDIELDYCEIENRNCLELAKFGITRLKSEFYTATDGNPNSSKELYTDAAPLFIPYAIDDRWHFAEIVKIGSTTYYIVDGVHKTYTGSIDLNTLILGGECGVVFKDFYIDTMKPFDAEKVSVDSNEFIISSWNPHIIVYMGHGMVKQPSYSAPSSQSVSSDRLHVVFTKLKEKGYIPVSINDIADYYQDNKMLPKRCFVPIFDDWRWENFTDLENRAVFTQLGIKPALAVITSDTEHQGPISENGQPLDINDAAAIGRRIGFEMVTHTRNHRDITAIKPSEYINEFRQDIYDADFKGIVSDILVYPFGKYNLYVNDTLNWLGFKIGIIVPETNYYNELNIRDKSRFVIGRESIAQNHSLDLILNKIV